ncbi:uncharacterized protein BDW70DRAFT_160004 [Aspergillus foveolatus]|uniref:uncharacterized protein n=1 Tax=Aspergillus foveolatus TaxID=210207 RepID=UPI003CCD8C72
MDSAVEREGSTMDGLEVVRAWITINPDFPPENVVWHHSVDDVVKAIITLPCHRGSEEMVELIVPDSDAAKVRRRFNIEMTLPLGSRDPMVLSQKPEVLAFQKLEAGQKLRETYLACQAKGNIDDQARTWLHRRLQWVSNELSTLLNSIQTVRAWKTIYQGPLMRDAKNKGVEDLILAEVHLEDPCNAYALASASYRPNGAIQVDLVVQQGDVAAVCPAYPPVNFSPFSDGDPLVFSYPCGDNSTKRALALSEVLFRYRRVHGIRGSQVQEQARMENHDLISYWFSKCIEKIEGYVKETHGCETKLVWCRNHQEQPMTDVRLKGLHDAVIAAVPLQEPKYRQVTSPANPDFTHAECFDHGRVLNPLGGQWVSTAIIS